MALDVDVLLSEGTKLARESLKELQRLAVVTENFPAICERAARRLIPAVRSELDISWNRTGLTKYSKRDKWPSGDKSGGLYEAWVKNSVIKANQQGILVYLEPGLGNKNPIYKRAGWFQHGGVRGISGKGKSAASIRQRLKREAINKRRATEYNIGENISRQLSSQEVIGQKLVVQLPRPIYFDGGQIDRLASKYALYVNEEIALVK
jgi:hypothetical protein